MATVKARIGTIDLTPTWTRSLPILLDVLECGTDTGKTMAKAELIRMAGIADAYVAANPKE